MIKKIVFIMLIFFFSLQGVIAKMDIVQLPKPKIIKSVPLDDTLQKRRSIRSFGGTPLSLQQISQLLWAAQGVTNAKGFRTAPSAGALYPLELYIVKTDGVWHYGVCKHVLHLITNGDMRAELSKVALNQNAIANAPVDIVITGIYKRTTKKYGERGVRYVHMEAGHVAQNILLEAVGLNLSAVPIGAFHDNQVQTVLQLQKDHIPLYIIPVGKNKC